MKYFLIAGERSGDLHGSFLIQELKKQDPQADIYCWGGDYMEKAGARLLRHYKDTAVMGFWEVVKSLRKLQRLERACKEEIERLKPDAVVFIDFPGFNLRIAEFTRKAGYVSFYYISPKVWAWNQKRALKLKSFIDKIFCILPFEPVFFSRFGMEVSYVGNPLKTVISEYGFDRDFLARYSGRAVIAVLPGSRQQEVRNALALLRDIASEKSEFLFLVAGVDNLPENMYGDIKRAAPNIEVAFDKTYEILKLAQAAVVTSGTATLEAALLGTPQVVVYRTSAVSYAIAKRLVKVPFISLVNLIAGREVVKELIQVEMNPQRVLQELNTLLYDPKANERMLEGYSEVEELIGDLNAPETAAREMVQHLVRKSSSALS